MKRLFISFILIAALCSCKKSGPIPEVVLDNFDETITLSLEDLLTDIEVVPLSTDDNYLLGPEAQFFITSKYIIAAEEDKIFQFNRSGEYIRTLMVRGRGPDEYMNYSHPVVDEESGIFYFKGEFGGKSFIRIDLATGKILDPLEFSDPVMGSVISNGYMYSLPGTGVIHISDDDGIKNDSGEDPSLIMVRYDINRKESTFYKGHHSYTGYQANNSIFKYKNDIYLANIDYSDTLFHVVGDKLSPMVIIKPKTQYVRDFYNGGDMVWSIMCSNKGIILNHIDFSASSQASNSLSIDFNYLSFSLIDFKGGIRKIESVYIPQFDLTIDTKEALEALSEFKTPEISPIPQQTGDYGFIVINAEKAVSLAETAGLTHLLDKIDEESNPVLIVGRIK